MEQICEKIEKMRIENNISVLKIATAIEMSHTGYTKMIEKKSISVETLKKIADFFGVGIETFFDVSLKKDTISKSENTLLREMIEELKSTNDFLKSLVLSKLDRLEKYNFGMNDEKLGKFREFALGVGVFK